MAITADMRLTQIRGRVLKVHLRAGGSIEISPEHSGCICVEVLDGSALIVREHTNMRDALNLPINYDRDGFPPGTVIRWEYRYPEIEAQS